MARFATAALLIAAAAAIDSLRHSRNSNKPGKIPISQPQLHSAAYDRPACINPKHAGSWGGTIFMKATPEQKESSQLMRHLMAAYQTKIHHVLALVAEHIHFSMPSLGKDQAETNGVERASRDSWRIKPDLFPYLPSGSACDYRIPQEVGYDYKSSAKISEATDALLIMNKTLGDVMNPKLEKYEKMEDMDMCHPDAVSLIADFKTVQGHAEVLANYLETKVLDETEKSLFRHLDEIWMNKLLYAHTAQCPKDWEQDFVDNRYGGRHTLLSSMWAELQPMHRCWKAWKANLAASVKEMRSVFDAAEDYGNWALFLCYRPEAAEKDCAKDFAVVEFKNHVHATYNKPSEIVKAYFTQLPAQERKDMEGVLNHEIFAETRKGQKILEHPLWKGNDDVIVKGYENIRATVDTMLNEETPDKGVEVNYIRYKALQEKLAAEWSAKDEKEAAEWSAKMTQGKAKPADAKFPFWAEPAKAAVGRRKAAFKHAAKTLEATFFSPDLTKREAFRKTEGDAALAWLEGEKKKRAELAAKQKLPAPIDCSWRPKRGMDVKLRYKAWIEYLEGLAASTTIHNQPVAPCMPSDAEIEAVCTATGKTKYYY